MRRRHPHSSLVNFRHWILILLLGSLYSILTGQAAAQSQIANTAGSIPGGLAPGAPAGSYPLSDFEAINLYNGRLSLSLPLPALGGRGEAGFTPALSVTPYPWTSSASLTNLPTTQSWMQYASTTWWDGSIKAGYGPGSVVMRQLGSGVFSDYSYGYRVDYYLSTFTNVMWATGDGTEYEFYDQKTNGQLGSSSFPPHPLLRGRVWKSTDRAMQATFISDGLYADQIYPGQGTYLEPSGYLYLKNGVRYRVVNGLIAWISDRNGNRITFSYDGNKRITRAADSLNREMTFAYSVEAGAPYGRSDVITYRGFGGATRIIRISRTNLANCLRPGESFQNVSQLFPELDGGAGFREVNETVSALWLPDGRSYQFRYNRYGEIALVQLPTGGKIEYDYGAGSANDPASGVVGDYNVAAGSDCCPPHTGIYRRLKERRVYTDAASNTLEGKTIYEAPVAGPGQDGFPSTESVVVRRLDSGGVELGREKHYLYGNPKNSILSAPLIGRTSWQEGKEFQTEALDAAGNVLRRVVQTWSNGHLTDTETTLPETNQVTKQHFEYDLYDHVVRREDYDYGTGAPGQLQRFVLTEYLTSGYDTVAGTVDDPDPAATIHLRGLPLRRQIYDGGGVLRAQTDYEYDSAALVDRLNLSGHDAAYTTDFTRRGNLTKTTRRLLDDSGVIIGGIDSSVQYDIVGNAVKVTDARGHATTIEYNDCFGGPDGEARLNSAPAALNGLSSYAFPTRVINALGHETNIQYDFDRGAVVDVQDPNGVKTSTSYNDLLDRPTQMVRAVGVAGLQNQTTIVYDDANHKITTTSDRDNLNDNLLKSAITYDGLGRTIETRRWESGTVYNLTVQTYDALGRVAQVSNPYRPGDSVVWTSTAYDSLGRVTRLTTPDGSLVGTSYSGNRVTVTDQAGKMRRSETDALGRLSRVIEDPDGLKYETSYLYDALGNLRQVTQGAQTRYFGYDAVSRLIRARNPEQDLNSGLTTLPDPVTGNSQWSVSYTYDKNGNVTEQTDARGVVTATDYDALNRPLTQTYTTANTTALATPALKYYYDGQTLPTEVPTFTRGFSTGRLVAVTYGGGSEGDYFRYNQAGQVTEKWQRTGTTNYRVQASYNLAGGVSGETYPSSRTVNYAFDQAGRLATFSGNLGDGVNRTYASAMQYDPAGLMKREQFGTVIPLYHRLHYNNRHQVYDIRLGTDSSATYDGEDPTAWQNAAGSRNRGALRFYYATNGSGHVFGNGGTNNNGNLLAADHFIPQNDAVSSYAASFDAYAYDPLNRLQRVTETAQTPNPPGGDLSRPVFQQAFLYDRWGNRRIDRANTWMINTTDAPPNSPPPPPLKDETVWVEDAVPAGASTVSDGDTWNWVSANPSPYSGPLSHQSNLVSGAHQHYFQNATQALTVNPGDRLYAHVYLDPTNPPTELMLHWNDGTWEHRAYWGANNLAAGVDGTDSRRYMGPLPATGRWVRLEVPASLVGLEGRTLNGMSFALYNGKATWDRAGRINSGDVIWVDDRLPVGASTSADGVDGWSWVTANPNPYSGTVSHQSNINAGEHQHVFSGATETLALAPGDWLYTYVYLDPANVPSEVMLQWQDANGDWEHRAYWGSNNIAWGVDGTNSRRYLGPLPAAGGWVRLEVPAGVVGLEGRTVNGMAFTLYGGRATWDQAGKTSLPNTSDAAWIDDAVPTGASAVGDGDTWNWVSANPSPYSGTLSHQSNPVSGAHQHYFQNATQTLTVNPGDRLYAHVYLDPTNPPTELMLHWNDGTWEHRAYWGANNLAAGVDGTDSRRYMGPLPATGRWVRLEVPASLVGLEGRTLNGMSFALYNGKATWDKAGKTGFGNGVVAGSGTINNRAYTVATATNRLYPTIGTMSYDAAGNLETDGYTNSTSQQFKYDAQNRMVEAYSDGALVSRYTYDGGGKRIRRIIGGQETWQVYGIGGELLAEYAATAPTVVQKEYGYRGGQLLITAESNGNVKWLVPDHLGTPRMVVDKSGALADNTGTSAVYEGVSRHDYLPFGEEIGSGVGIRSASIGYGGDLIRQKFTGKERDGETGMDFFSSRYYSPVEGRFVKPDNFGWSLTNPQSLNLYAYVLGNPLKWNDPTGHFAQSPPRNYNEHDPKCGKEYTCLPPDSPEAKDPVAAVIESEPAFAQAQLTSEEQARIDRNSWYFAKIGEVPPPSAPFRLPDAAAFNFSMLVSGFTGTLDAKGNFYGPPLGDIYPRKPFDFNASEKFLGAPNELRMGAGIWLIWLNQPDSPTEAQLNNFFTGWSVTGSAADGLGVGEIYSLGNGTATMIGVATPGVGVSAAPAVKMAETRIRWRP